MKLEITSKKALIEWLTEFITKKANFSDIYDVVMVQKETNTLNEAIKEGSIVKLRFCLLRLNKLKGGPKRIQEVYQKVKDEATKKCFKKYISEK
jgi:hypothetical protein